MKSSKFSFVLALFIFICIGISEVKSVRNGNKDAKLSSSKSENIENAGSEPDDPIENDDDNESIEENVKKSSSEIKEHSDHILLKAQEIFDDDDGDNNNNQQANGQDASNWTYDDQDSWKKTYPACGGPSQSPVNIRNRFITDRVTSTCLKWINYNVTHSGITATRIDNTVNVEANFKPAALLSGGPLTGDYKLSSIRWHWGFDDLDGSEHAINSRKHALEMHAIHYSTKYSDINQALASQNDKEAVLIVAILYRVAFLSSTATATLTKAIEHGATANDSFVPNELGLGFQRNYYTYLGSLTAPPCSPVVRWIVSGTIQRIRAQQMAVFRSLTRGNMRLVDTFRDNQRIENRTVDRFKQC